MATVVSINWIKTIYFNFKYLPINQAIKLPVFVYKAELLKCNGQVRIESDCIKPGMIRLGIRVVSLYPNNGIMWENHGGTVVFKGTCQIGNDSSISIGKTGKITFGNNFKNTAALKLASYCGISFGNDVRVAWEVIIMDTSFHQLKDINGNKIGEPYKEIIIGNNNWIPVRSLVLKGTKTPDFTIFGATSILNKDYTKGPTHSLMAGQPLKIKAEGIWRDMNDDGIIYESKHL